MSDRLLKEVNDAMIRKGLKALSDESGLHEKTIRQVARGARVPHRGNAYKLALACGLSEPEALALARECLPAATRAKKAG